MNKYLYLFTADPPYSYSSGVFGRGKPFESDDEFFQYVKETFDSFKLTHKVVNIGEWNCSDGTKIYRSDVAPSYILNDLNLSSTNAILEVL